MTALPEDWRERAAWFPVDGWLVARSASGSVDVFDPLASEVLARLESSMEPDHAAEWLVDAELGSSSWARDIAASIWRRLGALGCVNDPAMALDAGGQIGGVPDRGGEATDGHAVQLVCGAGRRTLAVATESARLAMGLSDRWRPGEPGAWLIHCRARRDSLIGLGARGGVAPSVDVAVERASTLLDEAAETLADATTPLFAAGVCVDGRWVVGDGRLVARFAAAARGPVSPPPMLVWSADDRGGQRPSAIAIDPKSTTPPRVQCVAWAAARSMETSDVGVDVVLGASDLPALPVERHIPTDGSPERTSHGTSSVWVSGFRRRERRAVPETVPTSDVNRLRCDGFLRLGRCLSDDDAQMFGDLIEEVARREVSASGRHAESNVYVHHLDLKHPEFLRLPTWQPAYELAQRLLGPQLRAWIVGRVVGGGSSAQPLEWHRHMPPPDPAPPWLSMPHSLNHLVYLDDVTSDEGALTVAVGSHTDPHCPPDEVERRYPTVDMYPRRGECIAAHGNLWHRTGATSPSANRRRLLFVCFTAAWVNAEVTELGVSEEVPEEAATRVELSGGFRW